MNKKIIKIKGARVHNLKNIDVEIPRDKLVIITGLSGSGKSSLAFDTLYAEGQRRYVESLSAYARQFIGMMNKPEVESIEGLSPAISIDQKSTTHNPRSTVGTVTEIYDYLRLLFARIGTPHCYKCGKKVRKYSIDEIINKITEQYLNQEVTVLSPVVKDKKGEHKNIMENIAKAGYSQIKLDGLFYSLEEILEKEIDKKKKHTIEVVTDKLEINEDKEDLARATEAIENALELSGGLVSILDDKKTEKTFSRDFVCPDCDINLPELEPRNFSFNSPHGACPKCSGLGTKLEIDPELILNPKLTIAQGGIKPLAQNITGGQSWLMRLLGTIANKNDFDLNTPIKDLSKEQLDAILYNSHQKKYETNKGEDQFFNDLASGFQGVIPHLEKKYYQTESEYLRKEIGRYMRVLKCPGCKGKRLKPEILAVKIEGLSIHDITNKSIKQAKDFFENLENSKKLSSKDKKISHQIIKEINSRLYFLLNVGLDYITLDRAANTLSGGEAQRIRLATQIGSALTGVLYILDEPSIGLHQRDNSRLISTLKHLRDLENTVIVVEHDESIITSSDWVIDVGPGAGEHGGKIIATGTAKQIKNNPKSLTGQYLSGKRSVSLPETKNTGNGKILKILGASENNLKNIDVELPLGKLIALTGVSGSGKSTLMTDIVAKALAQKFYRAKDEPGSHKNIEGISHIDKMIDIDQSPIGRTPRSNPATYTGAFTPIRDLFASTPEARIKGYKPGRFSFNVVGGRCEACNGDGMIKIEMQFLPDVYIDCEVCHGRRYNKEALEVYYKGKNIADVLEMTVEKALNFFENIPSIYQKLSLLYQVGLGYLKLGQSATTLSGGEAQRVKISEELGKRSTGDTLYILDEPTTGLHFDDIKKLLEVLHRLREGGNTVIVIEHNLDVIKSADYIIDLGPEGGHKGGEVITTGTPEEVAQVEESFTGEYLREVL